MSTATENIRKTLGSAREAIETNDRLQSDFVRSIHFWGPPLVLLIGYVYGIIGWNFVISLTDFEGLRLPSYAISNFDFEMYAQAMGDPAFWTAVRNTLALTITFTVACLLVGLLLAILLDSTPSFQGPYRTIYLLPFSLSFVVTAIYWLWMYNYSFGVINGVLRIVGLGFLAQHWLSNPQIKLGSVAIALIWQFSGYAMVIYLAGLQSISRDQYEAAMIDGASTLRMYRRVIIPQLSTSAMAIAIVLMVFALRAFAILFVLFGRDPGPSSDILATMMYRVAFAGNHWAYGAALGSILFLIAIILLTPYLYIQYQRGQL